MSSDKDSQDSSNYDLRGLAKFGGYLFSGFLVWCTFNYPMSEGMEAWFYVWAVVAWLLI